MCTTSPRTDESTAVDRPLFIAVELSTAEWRIAFTAGLDAPIEQRVIPAGDRARLRRVLAEGKRRCGLAATAPVRSCYEAGRDAFWPHRWLESEGVTNVVVDPASIEVSRRARHAKTDRLDARKLVTMLVRWALGERHVWQVVHVPAGEVEGARQRPRTRETLTAERTRWRNRIHAALATVGVRLRITATFPARLETAQQWDGTPVPPALRERVLVAWRLLQQIEAERRTLARALQVDRRTARSRAAATVRRLTQLRGVGDTVAWILATEVRAHRHPVSEWDHGPGAGDQSRGRGGGAPRGGGNRVGVGAVATGERPDAVVSAPFWPRGPRAAARRHRRAGAQTGHCAVAVRPRRDAPHRGGAADGGGVADPTR